MINHIFKKIFGSRNDRIIKRYKKVVAQINARESTYAAMSDEECRAQTDILRKKISSGSTLEEITPDAFALVRETAKRHLGQRHYDVQLIGGLALNDSNIAEMMTGEGKTLTATLPAYLNALSGQSVHIVTVNDYLAKRDANWMGKIFKALDMTVGVIIPQQSIEEKKEAYASDIIYATNNELGFDYLRDNMASDSESRVQSSLNFAVVDEVDSILIDEARTPLIISGPVESSAELYQKVNQIADQFNKDEDFTLQEKDKQILLTDQGHEKAETILKNLGLLDDDGSLYDVSNISLLHYLDACLRAHNLYQKDVDYMLTDDKQVMIIDPHTGRTLEGRRWSNGLHQAVEAKHHVAIQEENQTMASITFQNFFRLYTKLSGMTGTADTEAKELHDIYGLEVVIIPTHRPMVRQDLADMIFLSQEDKYHAIVADIKQRHEKGQPILVGTCSIESSEYLSALLKKAKIKHEVLNAKQHQREAQIIAQAGKKNAVTIATNMAGRGTDIVLGGNPKTMLSAANSQDENKMTKLESDWEKGQAEVKSLGGLHVLGTERNESRRVDNQLRGRSGRQGDPGSSQYYLSLADNLMRIFASDRVTQLMQVFGMKKGDHIQAPMLNKAIENAQRKVEAHHYDIRKQLLKYDDIANDQRKIIYQQRSELMLTDDIFAICDDVIASVIKRTVVASLNENGAIIDIPALTATIHELAHETYDIQKWCDDHLEYDPEELVSTLVTWTESMRKDRCTDVPDDVVMHTYRMILLSTLDRCWKEHLAAIDHLRQGIHLRSYAQKNPAHEFRKESFQLFQEMLSHIQEQSTKILMRIAFEQQDPKPKTQAGSYQISMNSPSPQQPTKESS